MGIDSKNLFGSSTSPFIAWVMGSFAAYALMFCFLLNPMPVMALVRDLAPYPYPFAFGTMSNRADATAKAAEGKLESAYGEITGDPGHQIKGKAKQVQGAAMNAAEDLKQGAKSVAEKLSDAAGKVADDLS